MTPFAYHRPASAAAAAAALAAAPDAGLLAGGTCLIDLMKQGVLRPSTVLDLNFAPDLAGVSVDAWGALHVGAATPLSHVARDRRVADGWPLLHEAIVEGLTPQLRNAASFGGNVMQRPRCIYFREPGFDCNKKVPGSGCAAQAGAHYSHAIFGADPSCIAVHPSDLCVALAALDARVVVAGPVAERTTPIASFLRLPAGDPAREAELHPGEMVTAVVVPPQGLRHGSYVKGTEGFALASCAALLDLRDGLVAEAQIVFGGVAHRPWRSGPAEAALRGRTPTPAIVAQAADAALAEAVTDAQTAFRLPLLRGVLAEAVGRCVARAGGQP